MTAIRREETQHGPRLQYMERCGFVETVSAVMPPQRVHDEKKLFFGHLVRAGAEDGGGRGPEMLSEIMPYLVLRKSQQAGIERVKAHVLKIGVRAERLSHAESRDAGYKNEADASLVFPDGIIESADPMLDPHEHIPVPQIEV